MKKIKMISSLVSGIIGFTSVFIMTGSAYGNDSNSGSLYTLEEVVVTARKREESLQNAPISITAFSGQDLERRNITGLADIGQITPNLVFNSSAPISGNSSTASVFIRGIGQNDYTLVTEPGVGIYIDGVYRARSVGGALDLVDVERIEVLRGPQGTLFGRNTIGGAISITSQKPDEELAGRIQLTVGKDQLTDLKGKLNLPLGDSVFSSFAISSRKRDGFVKNVQNGLDLGDDDSLSARAALRWLASDKVSVDFSLDATKERENGAASFAVAADGLSPLGAANNVVFLGALGCAPPPGPIGNTNCFNSQWVTDGQRISNGTHPQYSELDIWGAGMTIEWELSENLSFRSITSYRDLDSSFSQDADNSPVLQDHITHEYEQDQFSQELQLLGSFMDDRMKTVLGIYYFEEEGKDINVVSFPVVLLSSGGSIDNESKAIFGQITYDITDALSMTLGLRYTEDKKVFLPDQFVLDPRLSAAPPPAGFAYVPGTRMLPFEEVETDIDEITPMLNVAYNLSEATMLYATYSEGYKSGGYDQRVFPRTSDFTAPSFEPEFVESFELGMKYKSDDNRFRANGSMFFMDYTDLQIAVVNNNVDVITRNAGEAEIKGFELELAFIPADNWMLEGSLGYTDAEYTSLSAGAIQAGLSRDNELVNTPEWSLSAAISYTQPLESGASLSLRLDGSHRSEVFFDITNTQVIAQDDVSLVNFSVNYRSTGAWDLGAGITNLGDEEYHVSGFQHLNPFGIAYVNPARERQWWLRVGYSF